MGLTKRERGKEEKKFPSSSLLPVCDNNNNDNDIQFGESEDTRQSVSASAWFFGKGRRWPAHISWLLFSRWGFHAPTDLRHASKRGIRDQKSATVHGCCRSPIVDYYFLPAPAAGFFFRYAILCTEQNLYPAAAGQLTSTSVSIHGPNSFIHMPNPAKLLTPSPVFSPLFSPAIPARPAATGWRRVLSAAASRQVKRPSPRPARDGRGSRSHRIVR